MVNVIAYFCKNDTMKYQIVEEESSIENNDSTLIQRRVGDFLITVDDSTANGYDLTYVLLSQNYICDSTQNWEKSIYEVINKIDIGTEVKIRTDEMGRVQKILNFNDLKTVYTQGIREVMDSLYAKQPALDSIISRKKFETLMLLQCVNEETMRESFGEINTLFQLHGQQYALGEYEMTDSTDYLTQYHIVGSYGTLDEQYGSDSDYFLLSKAVTEIPAEDLKGLFTIVDNLLLNDELTEKVDSITNSQEFNAARVTKTNTESYHYFSNGWPSLMAKQEKTDVEVKGTPYQKTKIKNNYIIWTYRSWENFSSSKSKDSKPANL